jgi:hypothetical protein
VHAYFSPLERERFYFLIIGLDETPRVAHGKSAFYNAGAVMYLDLFYPFFLVGLLILYHMKKKEAS